VPDVEKIPHRDKTEVELCRLIAVGTVVTVGAPPLTRQLSRVVHCKSRHGFQRLHGKPAFPQLVKEILYERTAITIRQSAVATIVISPIPPIFVVVRAVGLEPTLLLGTAF
jgi:hypothetical protein